MLRQDSSGVATETYAYFPPYSAQFAGKAIDNSRTQSPAAAAENSDYCIDQQLQLLVPLGFALLARIRIARSPDLFDENLRGSQEFCRRRSRRAHEKPVAVTIKKRPCQKQRKKFHVDRTCARNWIEPPAGNSSCSAFHGRQRNHSNARYATP